MFHIVRIFVVSDSKYILTAFMRELFFIQNPRSFLVEGKKVWPGEVDNGTRPDDARNSRPR